MPLGAAQAGYGFHLLPYTRSPHRGRLQKHMGPVLVRKPFQSLHPHTPKLTAGVWAWDPAQKGWQFVTEPLLPFSPSAASAISHAEHHGALPCADRCLCPFSCMTNPCPSSWGQLPVLVPWRRVPKLEELRSESGNGRGFPQGGWVGDAKGMELGVGPCLGASAVPPAQQ